MLGSTGFPPRITTGIGDSSFDWAAYVFVTNSVFRLVIYLVILSKDELYKTPKDCLSCAHINPL